MVLRVFTCSASFGFLSGEMMRRRALVLAADVRDVAVLEAALAALDVGAHFVSTQTALFDAAYLGG
jgi:hypothetical protein